MLINKKHVRDYIDHVIKETGRDRFTRVSNQFYIDLEIKIQRLIKSAVSNHPSVGKTLDEFRS